MVGATVKSVWKGYRAWAGCHQLSVFQPKYGKSKVPQPDFFGDATIPYAWKRLPEFSAVWAYTPMMDILAARGWDVWMLDVRGYSRSTRPAEMDRPAADSKPIVDTATAARDVASVVEFVMKQRGVPKVNLMGWSWGTSIMGLYTTTHNDNVARLVLYAPQWLSTQKVPADAPPLGAYRAVTRGATRDRWLMGVPEAKKADLIRIHPVKAAD